MDEHTKTERDTALDELVYVWEVVPWYYRKALALALSVNAQMDKIASMRKTSVGYVIFAALIVSCTGSLIFVVRGNALMSLAFGGMLAATIMFAVFYLVWMFFK